MGTTKNGYLKQGIRKVDIEDLPDLIDLDGTEILKIRERAGLTRKEFAYYVGIESHSLYMIESGKRNPSTSLKILIHFVKNGIIKSNGKT